MGRRSAIDTLETLMLALPKEDSHWLWTVANRSKDPLASLDHLATLVTDEEVPRLAAILERADTPGALSPEASAYDRHSARSAARQRKMSREGREIGPLPAVDDPKRRDDCKFDLERFMTTYGGPSFPKAFGDDHRKAIKQIQDAILYGGQYAFAMPRGSGKSTICEWATIWALLYGHRKFFVLILATETLSEEAISSIREELEGNDLLLADFPEVCFPIRQLDGIAQKAKGQLLGGVPTAMQWSAGDKLVFPTVEGSAASGTIFISRGIEGAIRGLKRRQKDGRRIRPDFILIDDPQTDASARSRTEVSARLKIITNGLLGLAGPDTMIAAVCPCTVIEPGDVADSLLNNDLFPEWHGHRFQLVYGLPKRMDLWQQYFELYRHAHKNREIPWVATEFYRERQAEMDEGCVAGWPARFPAKHHISCIQFAMELYLGRTLFFFAEMQNDPQDPNAADDKFLRAEDITKKVTNYTRRQVPIDTRWITAQVDVQKHLFFYKVMGWTPEFGGYVLEYGTFPQQQLPTFSARQASPRLEDLYPGKTLQTRIYSGLQDLFRQLFSTEYPCINGVKGRLGVLGVDANWLPKTVKKACIESAWAGNIYPTHGDYFGPNECPISEFRKRDGEFIGDEWLVASKNGIRYLKYDANYWKTNAARLLATPYPQKGSVVIYGPEGTRHDLLARHLDSEIRFPTKGKRTVDLWELRPGESENHWWDCYIGNCVLASMSGAQTVVTAGTDDVVEKRDIRF